MLKTIFPLRILLSARLGNPNTLIYGLSMFFESKKGELYKTSKFNFTTKKPKQNKKQALIQKS